MQWVRILNEDFPSFKLKKCTKICEKHFPPKSIIGSKIKQLTPNAVPIVKPGIYDLFYLRSNRIIDKEMIIIK
jgi:hypothetical protein